MARPTNTVNPLVDVDLERKRMEYWDKQEQLHNERRSRIEARGNAQYNAGLLNGLGFFKAHLYPSLMRK